MSDTPPYASVIRGLGSLPRAGRACGSTQGEPIRAGDGRCALSVVRGETVILASQGKPANEAAGAEVRS